MPKILVLGLGNPLRGDDAAGLQAVEGMEKDEEVDYRKTIQSGASLLSFFNEYDQIILLDSFPTVEKEVGKVYELSRDEIEKFSSNNNSSHDMSFSALLELLEREMEVVPKFHFFLVGIPVSEGNRVQLETGLSEKVEKGVESMIKLAERKVNSILA